jgi:hypothetical protein
MYALQDSGLAVSAMPSPQVTIGPTDQLERRAVEPTERSTLATEDRQNVMYSSPAAVLQLLEDSAQGYAMMMEVANPAIDGEPSQPAAAGDVGRELDVYA